MQVWPDAVIIGAPSDARGSIDDPANAMELDLAKVLYMIRYILTSYPLIRCLEWPVLHAITCHAMPELPCYYTLVLFWLVAG